MWFARWCVSAGGARNTPAALFSRIAGIRWGGLVLSAVFALAALVAGGSLLSACSAPAVLPAVLGPPLVPKPVVHLARRPAYHPYEEKMMEYNLVPPPRADWPSKLEALPKTADGSTDWVTAMNQGLITPKPGLDPKAEEESVLDLNVELTPKDAPDFKVTYPHQPHTQLLACANCHPAIFQMVAGADPITMEKVFAGEYCGRCHGKVAFDPASACPRCHLSMPQ
jgi:c(7)-type cytochrome triheme protein